jgi:hypothetical protein
MSRPALDRKRDAAEELAALIHVTRFMSDIVPSLVDDPKNLKQHLDRLEAELKIELSLAGDIPAAAPDTSN